MKRRVLLLPIVFAALALAACDTGANPQANPLIGTWVMDVLDPDYPETEAVGTIIFTDAEFSYSYKLTSGWETSYKGEYIYTDSVIYLVIVEKNSNEAYDYAHEIYRIYNDRLYVSTGRFISGTYTKQQSF